MHLVTNELSGYGHELVVEVSRVRVLMPLKTRLVERLMYVKSVETQRPPVDTMWQLSEGGVSTGVVLVT
ncbi:hypothetical protein TNCV_3083311 [Trichonephila clavipes]|nr:hypothetical protein TNCV_3083311 [Trichonephila clavipes]